MLFRDLDCPVRAGAAIHFPLMPEDSPASRGPGNRGLLSFLSGLRFPQLFVLLAILFLADLVVPDLLPFADEVILGVLTLMTGTWRDRRRPPDKPPEKNVTPPEARE